MNLQEILKRPYARVFLQDDETDYITGLILEFPGCISQGHTPQEAWDNLNSAAESWLTAHVSTGRNPAVPEPFESLDLKSRQAVSRLLPLWEAVVKWRDKYKPSCDKYKPSCAESLISDRIYQDLFVLAEKVLKIVGYYRDPNE